MKESQEQNKIILDKAAIFKSLDKIGEYKNEKLKVTIKKWEDDDVTSNMFIIKTEDDCPFLGVINGLFEREGFGVNIFSNGDYYFGYFSENERNKHGIYSYKPKIENNQIIREYYYGAWKDNYKDGYGIYLWLKENKDKTPFTDFSNSSFKAYVGNISRDVFTKGTLLIKSDNNYFVYHGSFNPEGKKHGDLSFFYSAQKELLLYGSFENDNYTSGFIANFDNDGNIIKICKYDRGELTEKKNINPFEIEIIEKIVFNFRNIIMAKDYFGDIYKEFGNVIKFKEKHMNNLDILNSDKYIDIMNAVVRYNKITIFKDIENNVEDN